MLPGIVTRCSRNRLMRGNLCIIACVLMACSSAVAADNESSGTADWTGWLGPNRDGWVDNFEPPAQWPEKLEQVWQAEVGTGYGSPLVVGDRVYQHARQGADEVLWCLDLKSGETLWKQNWTVLFKIGGGGDFHGKGPKSSPSVADGRVFTMSISGDLSAWDAEQGDLLWRSDYGSRFKSNHPYWGASTSPIVAGNRVLVHLGTDNEGLLVALDAQTGKEVWSLGKDGPSYSSPLVVEIADVPQLVEWNHRALVGVDLATGQKLWEFPFAHEGTNQNMPTPAFHDGQILVGGENRGIYAVKPTRKEKIWTATAVWHQKQVALDMSSAVINDGLLYGMSHYNSGQFFCLDPETGDVLWEGKPRLGDNVMFLSIPGHVVALADKGDLKIIAAKGKDSEVIASYRVSETPTWAPPVLLQDSVLVKDLETLTRWKLR